MRSLKSDYLSCCHVTLQLLFSWEENYEIGLKYLLELVPGMDLDTSTLAAVAQD